MSGLVASRFWIDRNMLIKELEHSSLVQFYSAIFISAAVCATGLVKIPLGIMGPELALALAKLFWGISLVFGITLALFTPWRIITLNHGEPHRILGFWFLPPVGLFVLVFAGNFLALKTDDISWIDNMAILNAVLLGVTLFQSMMLFTLFLLRALAYPFPRMDVIPSFTIGLAPVGVSIIALLSYLPLLGQAESMGFVPANVVAPLIKLLALLLWGFGLWWLLLSLLISLTAALRKGIPVTLGYWAFIFPPAAFTIATLVLGQATGLQLVQSTGRILGYLVFAGWFVVSLLTVRGIFNRSIFNLPPSFSEILQSKEE
jgi:tellurite resistance protein TehA-like permease